MKFRVLICDDVVPKDPATDPKYFRLGHACGVGTRAKNGILSAEAT